MFGQYEKDKEAHDRETKRDIDELNKKIDKALKMDIKPYTVRMQTRSGDTRTVPMKGDEVLKVGPSTILQTYFRMNLKSDPSWGSYDDFWKNPTLRLIKVYKNE